jgi:transposase
MDVQSDSLRLETPRRFEILTGVGGRRRWPEALKAQIVAESLGPDVIVADVARRHGARSSQVFGWRKDAREGRLALPASPASAGFTPVVIAEAPPRAPPRAPPAEIGAIEIEARGVAVRIRGAADVALVEAIVRALRAST